jgi:hypothetical protein
MDWYIYESAPEIRLGTYQMRAGGMGFFFIGLNAPPFLNR